MATGVRGLSEGRARFNDPIPLLPSPMKGEERDGGRSVEPKRMIGRTSKKDGCGQIVT
jgi:hypothetical protein